MASIEAELKTYLKTKAAITSLVGSGTSARIYKDRPRQNATLPFIVIRTFDGFSTEHLGGISGLAQNRIQIDCHDDDDDDCYTLAEAVRLAPLQMFQGTMGSTSVRSVTSEFGYQKFHYQNQHGSDQVIYVRSRDYFIAYEEETSA